MGDLQRPARATCFVIAAEAVERLCDAYDAAIAEGEVNPLILIPCFVLDFLCIHPFKDGNGHMSRLLTLLLLYQVGCLVGRYISIEKAIADTKDAYYHALVAADSGWHANKNDPRPFIEYLLGVVLSCYRDCDFWVGVLELGQLVSRVRVEEACGRRDAQGTGRAERPVT